MNNNSIFSYDKSQIKIKNRSEFLFYYNNYCIEHSRINTQKMYYRLLSFDKKSILLSNLIELVSETIQGSVVFQIKKNDLSEILIINCKGLKQLIIEELEYIKMDHFVFAGKLKKSISALYPFLNKLDDGRMSLSTVYNLFTILNCSLEVYISPIKN